MSAAFSSSSSSSKNKAYGFLKDQLGGSVGAVGGATNTLSDLLGIGGADPFQDYLNSTGEQFQMDQGSRAITGNKAAAGLLNSGSTLKALNNYGQNMGKQYFQNYLTQVGQLGNLGLNAAQVISGAGQVSKSNSMSLSGSYGG